MTRVNGWKSRQVVDRYADDVTKRALDGKRGKGDMI